MPRSGNSGSYGSFIFRFLRQLHIVFYRGCTILFSIETDSVYIPTNSAEFNSDEHYIYYCRQESLRRNGVAIMVTQRVQNAVLGCNLKNDRMISVHLQGKPYSITVIQSMPQPVTLKKRKLNGFMKTYKIF